MSCHLVGHSKMDPIDIDESFLTFNNEMDLALKFNDQTEEIVYAEDITE